MPRNLDPGIVTALVTGQIFMAHMVMLGFRSGVQYAWSGVGPITWNGMTFLGVGSLGTVGDINEGMDVKARGTTVELSGIDPKDLSACLTDIQVGLPAKRWVGFFTEQGQLIAPYLLFSGQVDEAEITTGTDTVSITLNLESSMINHERASQRRYTTDDQRGNGYPTDTGFLYVESLNDQALIWNQH